MKKKLLFILIMAILVSLSMITACSKMSAATSNKSSPSTSSSISTLTPTQLNTTSSLTPAPTPTNTSSTISSAATAANWWDKFGTPQYGGDIIYAPARFQKNIDAYYATDYGASPDWLEPLWIPNWTISSETWSFLGPFFPDNDAEGCLAKSWTMNDPTTITVQIRQGVHWQNKPPVNGREFNAHDVEYHYDRFLGNGDGFTQPSAANIGRMGLIQKVTATGKYTVVFKFKQPSVLNFFNLIDPDGRNCIEAPEVIQKYGNAKDWRNAVGTGPWILSDYLSDTSFTYVKNPDYWGYDERNPSNKLPYADTFKVLYIPDTATRLAAFRTGKADLTDELDFQDATNLAKDHPELLKAKIPYIDSYGIDYRADQAPFSDIRVRKALDMAINRKSIATGYYKGSADPIPCGPINPCETGYVNPYSDWPQQLKNEYSYNPTEAKQLLAEAGYPNGFQTTILCSTDDDVNVVQIIKAQLSQIGVDVNIDERDPTTAQALGASQTYKMYWNRNTGATAQPSSVVEMFRSTFPMNFCQVKDPAFDAMCNQLDAAANANDVKKLVTKMDMYVLQQHWGTRLFPINTYNFWEPYLKGYNGTCLTRMGDPGGWLWARLWKDQSTK